MRDYTTTVDRDGNTLAEPVPMTCDDCGRPSYYDTADESYHHATDPGRGCFLIPAETRKVYASDVPNVGDRVRKHGSAGAAVGTVVSRYQSEGRLILVVEYDDGTKTTRGWTYWEKVTR